MFYKATRHLYGLQKGGTVEGAPTVKNKNDTKQHKRPRNPEGTHKDEGKREGGTAGETTTRQTKRRQATQTPLPTAHLTRHNHVRGEEVVRTE